jgi:hypothetical protein
MSQKAIHITGVVILAVLCFLYFEFNTTLYTNIYHNEYTYIHSFMVIFFLIYAIAIAKNPTNIFQPLHIFGIFYLCIFFITPLALINANEADCLGVNIMQSSVYATILVLLAFLFFVIGYTLIKTPKKIPNIKALDPLKNRKLLKLSYISFCVLSIINIGILVKSGFSLSFLLSLGNGSSSIKGLAGNMLFLINISYCMLVPWLLICSLSEKKWPKIISSYILFVIFFAYGWRFIIYIMAIAYSILYFRLKNKKPSFKFVISLIGILLIISVIMGSVRNNIRSGQSANFEGVNKDNIAYTLQSNFDIYKTFYGIVDKYPSQYDFWYGEAVFVSPIIMWVPRFIWPSKPKGSEYPLTISMQNALGKDVIEKAAMSSPNLTEYYLDFGWLGIIICSFALGIISKKMMINYYSQNIYDIIIYALFCGFLIQLINRGYLAQLITLLGFLYLPLFFIKKYFK